MGCDYSGEVTLFDLTVVIKFNLHNFIIDLKQKIKFDADIIVWLHVKNGRKFKFYSKHDQPTNVTFCHIIIQYLICLFLVKKR